jgi:hypothetical protein
MTVCGSFAKMPVGKFIWLEAEMGDVYIPHEKHANLLNCNACHNEDLTIKEVDDIHNLCLFCHDIYNTQMREEIAPIRCVKCHGIQI